MEGLKIPALGRSVKLGALYSAHTDQFYTGLNLFLEIVREKHYDEDNTSGTNIKYCMTNSIAEKMKLMDIKGETSLNILTGLVEVSGAASYLKTERKYQNQHEISLLYSISTVEQEIPSVKHMKIDSSWFEDEAMTHVVTGIAYGANCTISCKYESTPNEKEADVFAMLDDAAKIIQTDIQGPVEIKATERKEFSKIKFEASSDVIHQTLKPRTLQGALEFARELPVAIKKLNNGKGVPLFYTLLPLSIVAKKCNIPLKQQLVVTSTEGDIIERFVILYGRSSNIIMNLHTLLHAVMRSEEWFSSDQIQNLSNLLDQVEKLHEKFVSKFKDVLVTVRSGKFENWSLERVLGIYVNQQNGLPAMERSYQSHSKHLRERLQLMGLLQSANVTYYGKQASPFSSKRGEEIRLYLPKDTESTQELIDNVGLFRRLVEDDEIKKSADKTWFIVVDAMYHPLNNSKAPVIIKKQNGVVISYDLLKSESQFLGTCCVAVERSGIDINHFKLPPKREMLVLRCPNSYKGRCGNSAHTAWFHEECGNQLVYGITTKLLYCKCGSYRPSSARFRCSDAVHGMGFCLSNGYSLEEMSDIQVKECTNILILGETGVGKSTWINAIANYLAFDSLEKAMESQDNKALIPASFSYTDAERKIKKIMVGKVDKNEDQQTGNSATQIPRSYLLDIGIDSGTQIRLIDTPGIGDVRGIAQDRENFELILEHLSFFDKIHGICILLKSNNARIGVMLRFCIGELLTHLHRGAASNIMFCFTNCRGIFYRPGETLPVLEQLLKEDYKYVEINQDNQFCFDNESFRFLACVQNGIQFSKKDIETFSESWDRAVQETAKLFDYVHGLKPHDAESTVSLNNCRKWIIELSKPIAEIQKNVQKNISRVEKKKKTLEELERKGEDLSEELYLDQTDVLYEELEFPRTVCTHDDCVETKEVDEELKRVAKKPCHDRCDLKGIPTGIVGSKWLRLCRINKNLFGNCYVCSHSIKEHMHMAYDLVTITKREVDPKVAKKIDEQKDKAEVFEEMIKRLDEKLQKEKVELDIITNVSAKLTCYLKENSISTYNDAVEGHLSYLIHEQTKNGNIEMISRLKNTLEKYKQQKKILQEAVSNVQQTKHYGGIKTPQEAEKLKQQLFDLPLNGPTFQNISSGLQSLRNQYVYREVAYKPRNANELSPKYKQMWSRAKNIGKQLKRELRVSGARQIDDTD